MNPIPAATASTFTTQFHGYLGGLLRWDEFDALCQTIIHQEADASDLTRWYIYAIGEAVPQQPANLTELTRFMQNINELLHREHQESYCGIVYTDSRSTPTFVKIYDPHHLGSACGSGSHPPPLPGWTLSHALPIKLEPVMPITGSRKRWWNALFP
ncbi:MAG: hypothetical protein HQL49_08255 [Gammaproteobacteria bacterium]|nr:hypothetical protein [Gammaproteobacteria bacterium]